MAGSSQVVRESHGHPVRIVEGQKREHPSSVKTAICNYVLLFCCFVAISRLSFIWLCYHLIYLVHWSLVLAECISV